MKHKQHCVLGKHLTYWDTTQSRFRVVAWYGQDRAHSVQDCFPRQDMLTQRKAGRKAAMKKLRVSKDRSAKLKRITMNAKAAAVEAALLKK